MKQEIDVTLCRH